MKKRIIAIVIILLVSFSCLFYPTQLKATTTASTALEVQGAQIRTVGNQGLRFVSHVDYDSLGIDKTSITAYGTVVAYGEATSDELCLGATVNNKSVKYGETTTLFNETAATFTVVLYNISESQFMQTFTARAYVKYNDNGQEKIIYSNNVCSRSIYSVAKAAYESGNHHDFIFNIINTVDTKICEAITITEAKAAFDADSEAVVTIRGIITSVSSGTTNNAIIADETGSLVIYKFTHDTTLTNVSNIEELLVVGNEVIITSTITTYSGLYELAEGKITKCELLDYGKKLDSYQNDLSLIDNVTTDDQGKLVSGFAKYVSRSGNTLTFYSNSNFKFYVDNKWSTYTATDLVVDQYYYLHGFIGWYNAAQVVPLSVNNAVSSITNLSLNETLADSYIVDGLDLTTFNLNITLSSGQIIQTPVTLDMFSPTDLNKLSEAGTHTLTINYLGVTLNFEITLVTKEVTSIAATIPNLTYYLGDEIDLTGATILITYKDETTIIKNITSDMISGFDTTSKKTAQLTVTYQGIEDNLSYEVLAARTTSSVIIYEIYGGGGNTNATYNYDFVVLYNVSNNAIDLGSYYLQYTSSNSTDLNARYAKLDGIIYPNSYYVIQLSSNNVSVGASLPFYTKDLSTATSKLELAGTAGQVTLAYGSVAENTASTNILEYVKYSGLNNTKSYKRTNINVFEFVSSDVDLTYLSSDEVIMDVIVNNIKTTYQMNEELSLANASFSVFYSSGKKETVTVDNDAVSNFQTATSGTYTMQISVLTRTVNVIYRVTDGTTKVPVNIYYIDLGENTSDCGEATYIKVGDDIDILIDCGEDSTTSASCVNNVLNTYVKDNTLEYVIATHGHSDHIGGMPKVLCNYKITNVIEFYYKFGNEESDNTVIGKYLEARAKAENIYTAYELINNANSYTMNIADEVDVTFYNTGYLDSTDSNDKNKQSVVCCFDFYGSRVLFNGDAETAQEAVYGPLVGDVDIFKLGHHGTMNATSSTLLNAIKPEVAIVCNGNYLGNKYGHPTHEALSRIYEYSRSCNIYAITGATITSTQDSTIVPYALTAYRSAGTYKFQFNMTKYEDGLGDRNGIINICFDGNGYTITAEKAPNNIPIEMSSTAYYTKLMAYLVSVGFYTQNKANSLMHN